MLIAIPELTVLVAHYITFEAGALVPTRKPTGSGAFRHSPIYLEPGDNLRLEAIASAFLKTR